MSSATVPYNRPFGERRMAIRHSGANVDVAVRSELLVDIERFAEKQNTVRQMLTTHFGLVRTVIVMTVILLSFIAGLLTPHISRGIELPSAGWQSNLPTTTSSDSNMSAVAVGAWQSWNEAK